MGAKERSVPFTGDSGGDPIRYNNIRFQEWIFYGLMSFYILDDFPETAGQEHGLSVFNSLSFYRDWIIDTITNDPFNVTDPFFQKYLEKDQ